MAKITLRAIFGLTLLLLGACGISGGPSLLSPSVSISPTSGAIGTMVTLTGTDFTSLASIKANGVAMVPINATSTSLTALIMPGTTSGPIAVTTAGGSYTSSNSFSITATGVPLNQQGAKLVGTGAVGAANQGAFGINLSADGNTAVVGGWNDNTGAGAAWVFVRGGTSWAQQGAKLVGTGAVGAANQGYSVALSADGNTALSCGYMDNAGAGACWVFVRNGTSWTQQGAKLVGTGAVGAANQGISASLSADGNTALIGGNTDNSSLGAAWVFTRSGTMWTQQGTKLVGTGAVGAANQGAYGGVLSADGNTALVGGNLDNAGAGATWVFTRSGTTWTQQGAKLVGTGALGAANQGVFAALSADGNTALIGGSADNSNTGATWVFVRSGTTWTQQGVKLVGTGAVGAAYQGTALALSADGNTALIGGWGDNTNAGATWVFTRSGTTWTQQGAKLVGTGALGASNQAAVLALSSDSTTAMVGGNQDNSGVGACWVFTP